LGYSEDESHEPQVESVKLSSPELEELWPADEDEAAAAAEDDEAGVQAADEVEVVVDGD
jgi:hypothetical protein